ncbi:MAG: hypothetical protein ACT4O9_15300 [Blastocatellia bacterium]
MKNDVRQMPPEGFEAEQAKVDYAPRCKRRPPIVARRNCAVAFESPYVGRQSFSVKRRVLNERIRDDLPPVVVNEFAVKRICKN